MTPKKRRSRVYWRLRGGARRAYGDFRDYGDVGGRREPLIPSGERLATTDPDVATKLASERLAELEAARRRRGLTGRAEIATLAEQAAAYLVARKRAGAVTDAWIAASQVFLERAAAFFGAVKPMEQIRVSDVRAWAAHLLSEKGKTGKVLGAESVRRHLFTLSAVYRFAQESELLPPGFNPVAVLREKPAARQHEARWLEVPDAALLLEAARTMPPLVTPAGEAIGADVAYPLLATFLLTGGRRRSARARAGRRELRPAHRHGPPARAPAPQDAYLLARRAALPPARRDPPGLRLRPAARAGRPAPLPIVRDWRRGDAGGCPEAGRSRGNPGRLEGGRAHDASVPAYLDGRPAPDAGPGGTGEPLHRVPSSAMDRRRWCAALTRTSAW